ncbi:MBOAT, membrane-bound O-acyltransferase family-domain-containing protein [Stachybotrys elegans]|uniref:MBOAT, membrane-bound O-acyltransferase family-domain-containing protein n=1 Tax=Stachybotrys elegans TaxID=80388 RepID=A0A8K0T1K1_9HYPO|nr:MBOAT, membrane-bound O-acyltransferase family-domain-containing protein [Stachybotrys elegans]
MKAPALETPGDLPDGNAAAPAPSSSATAPRPRSLGEALRIAGIDSNGARTAGSETPSEEDYEQNVRPTLTNTAVRPRNQSPLSKQPNVVRRDSGVHIYPDDEKALQDLIQRSSTGAPQEPRKPGAFVFTRQFSAFDRYNPESVKSPFHGFYTLFWLGVGLYVFKIFAENWRLYGHPLGSNDIMRTMFHRDVLVLLISDGVMCALTGVTWSLQKLVLDKYLTWDKGGWIIQHIWQTSFIGGVIGWTLIRDWPWTHTVFFVMHGLIMLMKQHSYAFYNGHLSTVYRRRLFLLSKLRQLESVDPVHNPSSSAPAASTLTTSYLSVTPSAEQRRKSLTGAEMANIDKIATAIASGEALDDEQILLFERIIKWEVDALADELKGTATDATKAYPNNLTWINHYKWIPLPTVVYEIEYPRSDSIDWSYVAEKLVAMVGVIFVMIQISQHHIYPIVMKTVAMKETNVPMARRFQEFPWMFMDLMFPFMMEYLLSWYLIWETILNILAELTYFADRSFYDAWWNSVSWDQFARDWNRPVHVFLLRHVYHSSISSMKINKHTATIVTFFLSACVHELVMWCIFKKLRGYLLLLQMSQLPLVRLSRTKWLRGRSTLGNLIFWLGMFTGPSLLCSLYLIL